MAPRVRVLLVAGLVWVAVVAPASPSAAAPATAKKPVATKKPVVTTKKPVVTTRKAGNCHPSYTPCVPIASDVDCAGGSGNGPAYVAGPVRVIGPDVYDLDRDGNGIGCES